MHLYFIMLSLNNGMPTPMVDEYGDPEIFKTREDAARAASTNPLGQAFYYEV
jgi:hypothetical protein